MVLSGIVGVWTLLAAPLVTAETPADTLTRVHVSASGVHPLKVLPPQKRDALSALLGGRALPPEPPVRPLRPPPPARRIVDWRRFDAALSAAGLLTPQAPRAHTRALPDR
jgi:hypothetical protein